MKISFSEVFKINDQNVLCRQAKITPTKIGQFVTLWKRIGKNPIQPYDKKDKIDLVIVEVKAKRRRGMFIFSKAVLLKQGVFSANGKGGKRALRVYPSWDKPTSQQALKTQKWQLEFFIKIPKGKKIDIQNFKDLYNYTV